MVVHRTNCPAAPIPHENRPDLIPVENRPEHTLDDQ